jgi:hypothetical protein
LGPFLFSLGINDLIGQCKSHFNIWYLDDGTLGGTVEDVLSDYNAIVKSNESLGLTVNPSKSEIMIINEDPLTSQQIMDRFLAITPGIKRIYNEDLTLLGSPINKESMEKIMLPKLESLKLMTSRLETIDSHEALFLLKNAFSIPKLTYFMRTSHLFLEPHILEKFDKVLQESLQTILNTKLDESSWNQASLPVTFGGIGVRKSQDVALPAFISSVYGAQETVENLLPIRIAQEKPVYLDSALGLWQNKAVGASLPTNSKSQSAWDTPISQSKFDQLLSKAPNETEVARLKAVSAPNSSDWLTAIPVSSLGLKLDNSSLRIACSLRLGSHLCHQHTCICGTSVDSLGRHGLCCKKSAGRHPRHSHVNDLIKRALISADHAARLEPRGLIADNDLRPDGITTFPYKEGKCLIWDFTCGDTLCQSYVSNTAIEPGKAAEARETHKLKKYEELKSNYIVTPVAIETFGPWAPMGLKLIKEVGKKICDLTGEKRSTSYLFQSISIAIQRGNAASVMGTVYNDRKLEEIYNL